MSAAEDRLIRWIRGQVVNLTEDGIAHRLELYHVVNGQGTERLHTLQLKEGDDFDSHAQELWDVAERDATTRISSRGERYVILSFKDSEEPVAQYPILMRRISPMTDMMGSDTEAPNETGVVGQQLRHTETLHRILAGSTEAMLHGLQGECNRLSQRNTELETYHLKLVDMYVEAQDKTEERALMKAEAQTRAQRNDQLMGLLMTIGPMVVAQLFGARAPAAASAARDAGMQEFFERLTPDEMSGALKALKPQNQMALVEMFKSFAGARETAEQQKPEILQHGNQQKEEAVEEERRPEVSGEQKHYQEVAQEERQERRKAAVGSSARKAQRKTRAPR